MSFKNPILPGSVSDPSICRVGHDYYLAASSFEYMPGLPLWHSRDLVHWRPVTRCVSRRSQADLSRPLRHGGLYAPTLRWHFDRFYIACTNVGEGEGLFLLSARTPEGAWSDAVRIGQTGIDPDLWFDDPTGATALMTATAPRGCRPGIYQTRIDLRSGEARSEARLLWSGISAKYPEGPHIHRRGDWHYLIIAEGGSEYGHMVTVARSRKPEGPFVPCPQNPIFTHRDCEYDVPIHGVGHMDLVETPDGHWWAVFLAFRPVGPYPHHHHLGRETFLAPVTWSEDGWPVINGGSPVRIDMLSEGLPTRAPLPPVPVRDDFEGPSLGFDWTLWRSHEASDVVLHERKSHLRLRAQTPTFDGQSSPTLLLRRQTSLRLRAECQVEAVPAGADDEAGLVVFTGPRHHATLSVAGETSRRGRVIRFRATVGSLTSTREQAIGAGPLRLRVIADEDHYAFSFSPGEGPWVPLGVLDTRLLSLEVAGGFSGVHVGIYATSSDLSRAAPADFDWFDYEPL